MPARIPREVFQKRAQCEVDIEPHAVLACLAKHNEPRAVSWWRARNSATDLTIRVDRRNGKTGSLSDREMPLISSPHSWLPRAYEFSVMRAAAVLKAVAATSEGSLMRTAKTPVAQPRLGEMQVELYCQARR
jgi:hypothetical protein